jgi:hypothetical protein
MFAVHVTRVLRPVGVLLGGSGRARVLTVRARHVAALMKPISSAFTQAFEAVENRAVEGESC